MLKLLLFPWRFGCTAVGVRQGEFRPSQIPYPTEMK